MSYVQCSSPGFVLKDLKDKYIQELRMHDAQDETLNVHITRLKIEILHRIPGLKFYKREKDIYFSLENDLGSALFEACDIESSQNIGYMMSHLCSIIRQ